MSTASVSTDSDFRWLVFPGLVEADPGRELVGGKAWSLWRMSHLGLRVPPAFTVTTTACNVYFEQGGTMPEGLRDELRAGIAALESTLDRTFGGQTRPLLVSVRSGAAVSMPGMMDTILDLGVNDEVAAGLAAESGSPDFAAEVNRRFHSFYGELVLGCIDDLADLPDVATVRAAIAEETGAQVPTDPWEQLEAAVAAVFRSSRSKRAVAYRDHHGIAQDLGTAVTVQAMVFGNLDDASGTGVLFSRNPLTGLREPYGEYLPRGQGEDVVSGKITPEPLESLAATDPRVHAELLRAAELLDREGRDAQDIEFTIQHGVLYLLQSRAAKRTARAAVRMAVELHEEGVITAAEALRRVTASQVAALLRPVLRSGVADDAEVLARGATASGGVATGLAVATPEEAELNPGAVLVRRTTSPQDVHGMIAASAVVTELGGSTSHAAVVSRALDTPCIVGCASALDTLVGRVVTVDANEGIVYAGALATDAVDEDADADLAILREWATARSAVAVVKDPGGLPVFDADAAEDADPQHVPPVPPGTTVVAGACFHTEEGLRAALAAGVHTVVADPVLPVLLRAVSVTEENR